MEYLFLYLYQILGILDIVSIIVGVGIVIIFIGLWQGYHNDNEFFEKEKDVYNEATRLAKKLSVIFLIILILPTKQTFLLMGGAYFSKKFINHVENTTIFEKTTKFIELELDKHITKLQKK